MIDTDKLIGNILAAVAQKTGDKVYTDEPILRRASQMNNYLPPKYVRMKELAYRRDLHFYESDAAIFYRQALFMADFQDDCPYHEHFLRYFPTYRVLNDRQLRGYFTWRTNVRNGHIEPTALSFVFIYIYELLHLVGVKSAEEAFDALLTLGESYAEFDANVLPYLSAWLQDFYIYYTPDRGAESLCLDDRFDEALAILRDGGSDDNMYDALCTLSTYRLENSKFAKEHPEDVKSVVCGVYKALEEHYSKHNKHSLFSHLFGRDICIPYTMFRNAVFHEAAKHPDCTVTLTPMLSYRCKNGLWYKQQGCAERKASKKLASILKTIDSTMREAYGYKHPLKPADSTKLLMKLIQKEIGALREKKALAARQVITIDRSKLGDIRRSADITAARLIIEEDLRDLCTPAPIPAAPVTLDDPALSTEQYRFLQLVLYGGDITAYAREKKLMLSVLTDSINDALFDEFADTVLICEGNCVQVIDEYIDDLKGRITP